MSFLNKYKSNLFFYIVCALLLSLPYISEYYNLDIMHERYIICVLFILFTISFWYYLLKFKGVLGIICTCGLSLWVFGCFSNIFVITINNGYMPVLPSLYDSVPDIPDGYIRGGKYLFLGDCYLGNYGASVGDILMHIAVLVICICVAVFAKDWAKKEWKAYKYANTPSNA